MMNRKEEVGANCYPKIISMGKKNGANCHSVHGLC